MRPPLRDIPCRIDVPGRFVPKAQYALEMLLLPLGLRPAWTTARTSPGVWLYYGPDVHDLPPGAVVLHMASEAPSYFDAKRPYPADRVRWVAWGGSRWPVLFGREEEPDLVASAFFWLSGWQEYVAAERDRHGRFPYHASLQHDLGTAAAPAVDAYRQMLADKLVGAGIELPGPFWAGRPWVYCPTVDVDRIRKWHAARLVREAGAALRSPWKRTGKRTSGMSAGLRDLVAGRDPFQHALGRIIDEIVERRGTTTVFLKAGAHGPYDMPYALSHAALKKYLAELDHFGFEIGVHPSYHAHTHPRRMGLERDRVAQTVGKQVASVRQHYLRYELERTPMLQAEAGFRIDSSLGFAEHEGFRRATCLPFHVYDVAGDRPLPLWEMPVAAMDAALFNRRGFSPEEAYAAVRELIAAVRRFSGVLVVIWHNELWDEHDHPGWGGLFERLLVDAAADGALISSLGGALAGWGVDKEQ
ncbi:MAG TPA: polysaccharide deacetylase family protein [Rhodothermales bacterium]|nr:polysaccharide deacetylase family protein [Rhodothermales bacterium]